MKNNYNKITLLALFTLLCFFSLSNENNEINKIDKKTIKSIKKIIPDCEYFEGNPFKNKGLYHQDYKYTSADSTFIFNNHLSKTWHEVNSFFIKKTEVTNNEYKEFIIWVCDSIARTLLSKHDKNYLCKDGKFLNWNIPIKWDDTIALSNLIRKQEERFTPNELINTDSLFYLFTNESGNQKINIYPDTLCWMRYDIHPEMHKMAAVYLSNSEYKNYPVIGVSYNQALAFCDWKTKQFKSKHPNIQLEFYLPTELEWLYAATCNIDYYQFIDDEPSVGEFQNKRNISVENYIQSNTSGLITKTGFEVISNDYDGYKFTAPVKSYPPNSCDISDLQGNVSEWTSTRLDSARIIFSRNHQINSIILPYILIENFGSNIFSKLKYPEINNAMQLFETFNNLENICVCIKNNDINFSYSIPVDVSLINNIEYFTFDLKQKVEKALDEENHTTCLFFENHYGYDINHETINKIIAKEVRLFYQTFFTIDEIYGDLKNDRNEERMVVKGGSWAHPATHTNYEFFQHYTPNSQYPFLGFRYCVKLIDN